MGPQHANIIIDAQGFPDENGDFIVKNLALAALNECGQIIATFVTNITLQRSFKDVRCLKTRRTARWLTRNYHKLHWNDPGMNYSDVESTLRVFDHKDTIVYVKGVTKSAWCERVFQKASIRNLDLNGCPSLKVLNKDNNYICASENVKMLINWMTNK